MAPTMRRNARLSTDPDGVGGATVSVGGGVTTATDPARMAPVPWR